MSKHQYEASFSVSGDIPDLQALTKLTGIQPDNTHIKGQRKSDRLIWSDSLWEISSKQPLTTELEDQIRELISRVEPFVAGIRRLVGDDAKILFWCAHYTDADDGFCGGPALSAQVLSKMGSLGIDFVLQTYAGTNMDEAGEPGSVQ